MSTNNRQQHSASLEKSNCAHQGRTRKKVAIYDSGAGGLSIVSEIMRRKLNCDVVYFADTEKFPYGALTESELQQRACTVIDYLDTHYADIGSYIVACNTASTSVLPHLRARTDTPVIGVVPAIKPAAKHSITGEIGLLATPGTVSRAYLDTLIRQYAGTQTIYRHGSATLVECAEHYVQTGELQLELIEQELLSLLSQSEKIDTVILACTHFPLLAEAMASRCEALGITLIDSTCAIVNRLEQLNSQLKHESLGERESLEQSFLRYEVVCTDTQTPRAYQHFIEAKASDLSIKIRGLSVTLP